MRVNWIFHASIHFISFPIKQNGFFFPRETRVLFPVLKLRQWTFYRSLTQYSSVFLCLLVFLAHHDSLHAVPQVVKSCTEFIEKHGVVDGIYRLSGISSNIQKLRCEKTNRFNGLVVFQVLNPDFMWLWIIMGC